MENKFGNINIRKEFNVEKDPRVYEAIRMVENMLKDRADFVSITPVGSRYRGYSTKSSDIDLLVLFDIPVEIEEEIKKNETNWLYALNVPCSKNEWICIGEERIIPRYLKIKDLTIEIHTLNINIEKIEKDFQKIKDNFCLVYLAICAQAIFSPSSNKKIILYRKKFKELFNEYIVGSKNKRYFIKELANVIAGYETIPSTFKMLERISNFDYKKRLNQVKDFWTKRLNYFLLEK